MLWYAAYPVVASSCPAETECAIRPAQYLRFFFSSRRRHRRYIGDWSSDVCSSDLVELCRAPFGPLGAYSDRIGRDPHSRTTRVRKQSFKDRIVSGKLCE